MKQEKPFIHLFKTSTGCYFFDVNTDSIVKVSEETYEKLEHDTEHEEDKCISNLRKCGLLKPNNAVWRSMCGNMWYSL